MKSELFRGFQVEGSLGGETILWLSDGDSFLKIEIPQTLTEEQIKKLKEPLLLVARMAEDRLSDDPSYPEHQSIALTMDVVDFIHLPSRVQALRRVIEKPVDLLIKQLNTTLNEDSLESKVLYFINHLGRNPAYNLHKRSKIKEDLQGYINRVATSFIAHIFHSVSKQLKFNSPFMDDDLGHEWRDIDPTLVEEALGFPGNAHVLSKDPKLHREEVLSTIIMSFYAYTDYPSELLFENSDLVPSIVASITLQIMAYAKQAGQELSFTECVKILSNSKDIIKDLAWGQLSRGRNGGLAAQLNLNDFLLIEIDFDTFQLTTLDVKKETKAKESESLIAFNETAKAIQQILHMIAEMSPTAKVTASESAFFYISQPQGRCPVPHHQRLSYDLQFDLFIDILELGVKGKFQPPFEC